MQAVPRSITVSGTFFREDLVKKLLFSTTILTLPMIQEEQLSVNGEKNVRVSTGKLPLCG